MCRTMVSISAFQAEDVGSIPITCFDSLWSMGCHPFVRDTVIHCARVTVSQSHKIPRGEAETHAALTRTFAGSNPAGVIIIHYFEKPNDDFALAWFRFFTF